jgi:hypothetical protein
MGVELLLLWRQQRPTHEMILKLRAEPRMPQLPICPLCVGGPVRERMEVKM